MLEDEIEENIEEMENGYEDDPTQPSDHVKNYEKSEDIKDFENEEGSKKRRC